MTKALRDTLRELIQKPPGTFTEVDADEFVRLICENMRTVYLESSLISIEQSLKAINKRLGEIELKLSGNVPNRKTIQTQTMTPEEIRGQLVTRNIRNVTIAQEANVDTSFISHVIYGRRKGRRVQQLIAKKLGKKFSQVWPATKAA